MAFSGSGAAGGAASGAMAGSAFGPWGAAAGGVLGGVAGGMGLFGGGDSQKVELPRYVEEPSKEIGYGVESVLQRQKKEGVVNAEQQAALERMRAQAQAGSGLGQLPTQVLQQVIGQGGLDPRTSQFGEGVLSGAYNNPMRAEAQRVAYGGDVGSNPYLDQTYDRAARGLTQRYQDTVSPGMTSQAAAHGRLGSGAYARMRGQAEQGLATGLGDLANQVYGGAYENDRTRQMQALGLSGQMAQQDVGNQFNAASLFDTGLNRTLSTIGLTPQAMAAQQADAQYALDVANLGRDLQYRPMQTAGQALAGAQFGQATTTQYNPLIQAIGVGSGLYSTFKPDKAAAT